MRDFFRRIDFKGGLVFNSRIYKSSVKLKGFCFHIGSSLELKKDFAFKSSLEDPRHPITKSITYYGLNLNFSRFLFFFSFHFWEIKLGKERSQASKNNYLIHQWLLTFICYQFKIFFISLEWFLKVSPFSLLLQVSYLPVLPHHIHELGDQISQNSLIKSQLLSTNPKSNSKHDFIQFYSCIVCHLIATFAIVIFKQKRIIWRYRHLQR